MISQRTWAATVIEFPHTDPRRIFAAMIAMEAIRINFRITFNQLSTPPKERN